MVVKIYNGDARKEEIAVEQNDGYDQVLMLATKDAEIATKIVAKSFYKILRKKGFTDDQIVYVSSYILDCLLQSLRGYKLETSETTESNSLQKSMVFQGPNAAAAQIIKHDAA